MGDNRRISRQQRTRREFLEDLWSNSDDFEISVGAELRASRHRMAFQKIRLAQCDAGLQTATRSCACALHTDVWVILKVPDVPAPLRELSTGD
jgi:hypothetical protein